MTCKIFPSHHIFIDFDVLQNLRPWCSIVKVMHVVDYFCLTVLRTYSQNELHLIYCFYYYRFLLFNKWYGTNFSPSSLDVQRHRSLSDDNLILYCWWHSIGLISQRSFKPVSDDALEIEAWRLKFDKSK